VAALRWVDLSAILLLVTLAPGCGKFKKNRECSGLAQRVNAFIGETRAGEGASQLDSVRAAKESRQLAERYRKLSADLAALDIESQDLVAHVASYRKLADDAASALEGAAVALDQHDLELARTRRLDFDRAAKNEKPLVRAINDACSR
jgi:hypothetical protein